MVGALPRAPREGRSPSRLRGIESSVLTDVGRFRQKPELPQEDAVHSFIQRYGSKILGVLSGFDRLVLRGNVRQVAGADVMGRFLWSRGVLLKDFGKYADS